MRKMMRFSARGICAPEVLDALLSDFKNVEVNFANGDRIILNEFSDADREVQHGDYASCRRVDFSVAHLREIANGRDSSNILRINVYQRIEEFIGIPAFEFNPNDKLEIASSKWIKNFATKLSDTVNRHIEELGRFVDFPTIQNLAIRGYKNALKEIDKFLMGISHKAIIERRIFDLLCLMWIDMDYKKGIAPNRSELHSTIRDDLAHEYCALTSILLSNPCTKCKSHGIHEIRAQANVTQSISF